MHFFTPGRPSPRHPDRMAPAGPPQAWPSGSSGPFPSRSDGTFLAARSLHRREQIDIAEVSRMKIQFNFESTFPQKCSKF